MQRQTGQESDRPIAVTVNGESIDVTRYWAMHEGRFRRSLSALCRRVSGRVLEIGGHPWAMTSMIAEADGLELGATVSAEEITKWPDDIGVTSNLYRLRSPDGTEIEFRNFSLNIERDLVDIEDRFDAVIACEVLEHLIRAPHIMLLNVNRWLKMNGVVLLTTPNGVQFSNPFRMKNARPALRCYTYERHNCLFTLDQLEDLVLRSGFRILDSGYWNVYRRGGLSRLYSLANLIPGRYFQEKFSRTIFLIAQKEEERDHLKGCPKAYIQHPDWEYIGPE